MRAWALGLAQIPFIINFFWSIKWGRKSLDNPWEATTLEWRRPRRRRTAISTRRSRSIRGPYEYSVPGQRTAISPRKTSLRRRNPSRMEIPYTVKPRPDTGLYNAKLGIWLFLASEVMLFGALFSSYILLRVGAPEGTWPHHWLNIWLGMTNTLC